MKHQSKTIGLGFAALVSVVAVSACSQTANEPPEEAAVEVDPASLAGMFGRACGADIANHCDEVLPGDGRVQSCLYAHQDLISDECFAATEQTGVMLERLFDRFDVFYKSCNADLLTYCADADVGGGAQIACLQENAEQISAPCQERLPGLIAAVADDD